MSDLEYLWRAAAAAEKAIDKGAVDEADALLGRTLEALDHELASRGSIARPAMFEDLLLAAQQAREPVPVEKESVDVESR